MSFIEVVCLINTVLLFFFVLGSIADFIESIKNKQVFKRNLKAYDLLLFRVLRKAEEIVREKGINSLSGEDVFDIYVRLPAGATEEEIDEEFKAFLNNVIR